MCFVFDYYVHNGDGGYNADDDDDRDQDMDDDEIDQDMTDDDGEIDQDKAVMTMAENRQMIRATHLLPDRTISGVPSPLHTHCSCLRLGRSVAISGTLLVEPTVLSC